MIRIIILIVLSMLVAQGLGMMFGSGENDNKKEVEYFVTAKNGAVGCLSKDKFREQQGYYLNGNFKEAQRLIDEQECFFLKEGTKMFALEGTCSKDSKNEDLFPFKPNDFLILQPYLPCGAVR